MKHQRAVRLAQASNDGGGRFGDLDPTDHSQARFMGGRAEARTSAGEVVDQKNPSAFVE
jgi:hypothetical protein